MKTDIVKNPQIIPKQDSTALSTGMQQCDIEFVFTRLKTQAWREIRIVLQRRASIFAYNPDRTTAYAGFKITPENAHKVADIYNKTSNQKGVVVRIKGTDIDSPSEMYHWGNCWILSHAATDKHKYCTVRNWDPQIYTGIADWREYINRPCNQLETRLTLPCKCVWFKPDLNKPGTFKEQFMDDARTRGCDKCPLFRLGYFRMRKLDPDEHTARQAYKNLENLGQYIQDQFESVKGKK